MFARARRIFAAAAVIGGALAIALATANQADRKPLKCREFRRLSRDLGDAELTYYVAIANGYTLPEQSATRPLGECNNRRCLVSMDGCGARYRYEFDRGTAVAGHRLYTVHSHRYFAGAWKELAEVTPEVTFLRAHEGAYRTCRRGTLTARQCRLLLATAGDCWARVDGGECRNGRAYGPGRGGVMPNPLPLTAPAVPDACVSTNADKWMPCDDEGKGKAHATGALTKVFPTELDL